MELPNFVKIQGKTVTVKGAGRGYVTVGETVCDLREFGRKIYDEAANDPELWGKLMFQGFEKALRIERKRIKNN